MRLLLVKQYEKAFVQQFVLNNGLGLIQKHKLLSDENNIALINDTLGILNQIARLSQDYYEAIHMIRI